jgi:hypothetical protein
MSRLAPSIAILIVASSGLPALAADYGEELAMDFRSGYQGYEPKDWNDVGEQGDGIHIETGLRYWYSLGSQSFGIGSSEGTTADTAHNGELFLRIEDDATSTYIKGVAGYSAAITGEYETFSGSTGEIVDGQVGYAGADFGWNAFSDKQGSGVGGFIGYQYWNDSPRSERDNYALVSSAADVAYDEDTGAWSFGMDGVEGNIDMQMLRLGFSGKVKVADTFDISAEMAAVPYATIAGRLGGTGTDLPPMPFSGCNVLPPASCAPLDVRTSPLTIEGHGYGAMGELMVGMTPVENLTFRIGGRAWYLEGTYDATFTGASITAPQQQPEVDDPNSNDPADTIPPDPLYSAPQVTTDDYITTNNPWSVFRYGLLAELTYSF